MSTRCRPGCFISGHAWLSSGAKPNSECLYKSARMNQHPKHDCHSFQILVGYGAFLRPIPVGNGTIRCMMLYISRGCIQYMISMAIHVGTPGLSRANLQPRLANCHSVVHLYVLMTRYILVNNVQQIPHNASLTYIWYTTQYHV